MDARLITQAIRELMRANAHEGIVIEHIVVIVGVVKGEIQTGNPGRLLARNVRIILMGDNDYGLKPMVEGDEISFFECVAKALQIFESIGFELISRTSLDQGWKNPNIIYGAELIMRRYRISGGQEPPA